MTDFESKKNIRAGSYTILICVCLFIIFFFVKWSAPALPEPMAEEGIEVNLGSSDKGLGTDQPYEPGPPAPAERETYNPPKATAVEMQPVKEVETDDKNEDAPAIKKPPVVKPEATRIAEKDVVKAKPVKAVQPVEKPAPAPPKPKAVFKGVNGTGRGGNEADDYKKGGGEGIAGGKGDQGNPGGDPNSKNYEGSGGRGNAGVTISRGLQGRRVTSLPSFEDEFNQNAKIALNIKIDASGKVVSAVYEVRGSTSSDANLKAIAVRKAMQIKFNDGSDEAAGTIVFNFKLRN